ncbi:MAG: ankyrin repeat domain-containing protein [Synergistaceae bacterium]|nr:ankyrin repeat domain-containing protein [Synergistaceae bacterium]
MKKNFLLILLAIIFASTAFADDSTSEKLFKLVEDENATASQVKDLIEAGADVNFHSNDQTLLMHAYEYSNYEIAKILLEYGADVNEKYGYGGSTVLIEALSEIGELSPEAREFVKVLIKAGADVNLRDDFNCPPLVFAAEDTETIKILLDAGADVNASDNEGETILIRAAAFNPNPDAIKILLDAGADLNAKDENGMNALIRAAGSNENPEITKILINAGLNVNSRDNERKTPLIWATTGLTEDLAEIGNPEVVKFLLQAGANPKLKDKYGKTALDYAREENITQIKKILEDFTKSKSNKNKNSKKSR